MSNKELEKRKIEYPEGVVDREAYKKYLSMQEELDSIERIQYLSNGVRVDVYSFEDKLLRKLEGATDEEYEKVMGAKKLFKSLVMKVRHAKKKAFKLPLDIKGMDRDRMIIDIRKTEVLELFGKFHTKEEIHKIMCMDWGYEVTGTYTIEEFRRKNLAKIQQLQSDFKKSFENIRLCYKRSRLEELTWIYEDLKDKYIMNGSNTTQKELRATLEQIRKEIEGDKYTLEGNVTFQLEQTLNVHIQQEILQNLNLTQIILGRVAGRLNINPLFLISRLYNSFHAQHTGFKTQEEGEVIEIAQPSALQYDWDKIKKQYEKGKEEEKGLKELPEVSNDKSDLDDFREKLNKKLRGDRGQLNQVIHSLNVVEAGRTEKQLNEDERAFDGKGRKGRVLGAKNLDGYKKKPPISRDKM